MVYRGKPSTACGECRQRRSRCDRAVPACGQCLKAKRPCPGYRNTTDLMFHDHSRQVAEKTQSRVPASKRSEFDAVGGPSSQRVVPRYSAPIQMNDVVLYQPLDGLGINFFMHYYVGSNPRSSQFGYLPDFYFTKGFGYEELQESLNAVGLAGFAKTNQRADLMSPATRSYIAAVRSINKALSDPKGGAREATLISVMLLAMFEVMILPRKSGLENLSKHLRGAVSIASLCIEQKKLTSISRKLLGTVIQSVVMDSWIQNKPLPPEIYILREELAGPTNPESVHANFLDIVMELIEFRTALDRGGRSSPGDLLSPRTILSEALRIDLSLSRFADNIPKQSRFDKFFTSTEGKDVVYDGYYHVYPANFAAHLWNNIRQSRIRLHLVIIEQSRRLQPTPSTEGRGRSETSTLPAASKYMAGQSSALDQEVGSEAIVKELAEEICATVPQLADYIDQLPSYIERLQREKDEQCTMPKANPDDPHLSLNVTSATIEMSTHFVYDPGPFKPVPKVRNRPPTAEMPLMAIADPKPASLYHIFFQLQVLSMIPLLPSSMKDWIHGRLRWIEEHGDLHDLENLKMMIRKRK